MNLWNNNGNLLNLTNGKHLPDVGDIVIYITDGQRVGTEEHLGVAFLRPTRRGIADLPKCGKYRS